MEGYEFMDDEFLEYLRWKGFDAAFLEILSLYVDAYLLFLKDKNVVISKAVADEIAGMLFPEMLKLYRFFEKDLSEEDVRKEVFTAVRNYLGLK